MKAAVHAMLVLFVALNLQQPPSEKGTEHRSYSYGTIQNVCGPTDSVELLLLLTQEPLSCGGKTPRRYIRLSLGGPFPQTITLPAKNPRLQAYRCAESDEKVLTDEPAVSGTVTINSKGREGHYDLMFKNGEAETGDFKVRQCMSRIVCG